MTWLWNKLRMLLCGHSQDEDTPEGPCPVCLARLKRKS